MEKLLAQLVERLQKAYGDRLISVILYGSAAAGDHQEKFSDYNILCVLREITPRELEAGEDVFRWWREQCSPAPLLLTEHELATATDCFAIEFLDIQRSHRILFGKDVITPLVVDQSFYRAEVEHELRAKLLRLRQKAGGVLSNPDRLRRLLLDSISTFCVLFSHALMLAGAEVGTHKRDVIACSREVFGIDTAAFEILLDVREGRRKPRDFEPVDTLSACLKGIAQVIDAVDQLAK